MPLEPRPTPVVVSEYSPPDDRSPISDPTKQSSDRDAETIKVAGDFLPLPVVDETEVLQASIRAGSVAQIVVAAIAVIGLIYLLKLVMVTTLFSILLAFVLEPLVSRLARIGIPRAAGALLAVALLVGLAGGLTYFFYSRAVDFATQLPKYSGKIHSTLASLRAQTSKIEESTRSVIASPNAGKPPMAVEIREAPGLSSLVSAGSGTLGEVLLANQLHSLSGVLHAYVEGPRAFLYRAPVSEGTPARGLPHRGKNIDDDPQFHCRQFSGGTGHSA